VTDTTKKNNFTKCPPSSGLCCKCPDHNSVGVSGTVAQQNVGTGLQTTKWRNWD